MLRVVSVGDVKNLVEKVGLETFFLSLIDRLEKDFKRWKEFDKSPRHACYYPNGVIELMPISDKEYYAFKYVNGHPLNPKKGKLTVAALGLLSKTENGYPILFSEMTLLTGIRTAAVSALATRYLARKNAKNFGIIGTGAQSEFQTLALAFSQGVETVRFFDTDKAAMDKFMRNLQPFDLDLIRCENGQEVVENSDIVTSATAVKAHAKVIEESWVQKGTHINAVGGDSPGKTEIDPAFASKCKIVIEQYEQSKIEGEIQQVPDDRIYAEMWELAAKQKKGRESDDEITLFDSVGFAIEDYSTLRLVHDLAEKHNIGHKLDMVPDALKDPKDLFSLLRQ